MTQEYFIRNYLYSRSQRWFLHNPIFCLHLYILGEGNTSNCDLFNCLKIALFIFGCAGPLLLCGGFLLL